MPPHFDDGKYFDFPLYWPLSEIEGRTFYFKLRDLALYNESDEDIPQDILQQTVLDNLLNITAVSNDLYEKVEVLFEKQDAAIIDSYQVVVCYNYGEYANIQDLCDEDEPHTIINALGECFTLFEVNV